MPSLWKTLFLPFDDVREITRASGVVDLPFVVRPVATRNELEAVARMRRNGYRLNDASASELTDAKFDLSAHAIILGAFDKQTDQLVGTIRVVLGSRGPVEVASYSSVPTERYRVPHAEARWFCVPRSRHAASVKLLLCKALYLLAAEHECASIVVAAKRSMQGLYRLMQFDDVAQPPVVFRPPGHIHQHTLLGIQVAMVEPTWRADPDLAQLHHVFFKQTHPDLVLQSGLPGILNPLVALANERPGAADLLPVAHLGTASP